jgi:hypothetical protein
MSGALAPRSRGLALVAVALAGAAAAEAQERRLEVGGTLGWTSSDGVRGRVIGTSRLPVTGITPDDGLSYSLFASYFVNENVQLGLQAARQESELRVTGAAPFEIGAMDIESYHAVSTTLLGDDDLWARPYFLFGLGVTRFGRVNFTGLDGLPRNFKARTRFSPTLGTGAKFYLRSRKYGVNVGVRWTPTFLRSRSEGFWCDPYWGCFLAGNDQVAHQLEVGGGFQLRF